MTFPGLSLALQPLFPKLCARKNTYSYVFNREATVSKADCEFHGYQPRVGDFVSSASSCTNLIFRGISQYWPMLPLYWQRAGSHEVGLSKCHQKCQHVTPEYFGHPPEFKGINKFIVLTKVFFNLPHSNNAFQWPDSRWLSGVFENNKNTAMRSFNILNELYSLGSIFETLPWQKYMVFK